MNISRHGESVPIDQARKVLFVQAADPGQKETSQPELRSGDETIEPHDENHSDLDSRHGAPGSRDILVACRDSGRPGAFPC